MKQLLIATTLITAFTCHGQGTLGFSAGSSAATRIATNSTFGGPSTGLISGGIGSYYFALFVAPNGASTGYSTSASLDPTQNGFTLVSSPSGPYATNSALGRFNGNPTPTDPMTINGYAAGSSADFVVVGWSANVAGPDWSSFLAWWNNGNVTGPVGWAAHSSVATGIQLGGGGPFLPEPSSELIPGRCLGSRCR